MKNLLKVPSVVQIWLAEFLCILFVSAFVTAAWNTLGARAPGEKPLGDMTNWLWYLLGFALLVWSVREILRPRIKRDSWVNFKTWTDSGGDYPFCSTHPSYVLVELITVAGTGYFLWAGLTEGVNVRFFAVMFALALFFPALRLFAWYVLDLRIRDADETAEAWKPAAWLAAPAFAVFALIAVLVFVDGVKQKRMIAELPVVDEQTFGEGRAAFARLADASHEEKVTRFVRVRARQLSDGPAQCKNYENFEWATVLADLGAGGDVLIVGHKGNDDYEALLGKSSGNRGQLIEAVGRLREMPPRDKILRWKAYCGLDQLPPARPAGRWVLELELP
ncbi:MAG TPA: hypothetical protein VN256_05920 [Pyrinomonadaceae bacterium]|nr:hypothetical protein [Pyrinomonadaceae bacterium]